MEDRRRQPVKVNYRYCGMDRSVRTSAYAVRVRVLPPRRPRCPWRTPDRTTCMHYPALGSHASAGADCSNLGLPSRPTTTEQSGARLSRQAQEHQDRYDQLPRKHGAKIPRRLCLTHFFETSVNLVTSGPTQHDSGHHGLSFGGERGIRTLEGLLTLTPLAGVRLRPLGHLSASLKSFSFQVLES